MTTVVTAGGGTTFSEGGWPAGGAIVVLEGGTTGGGIKLAVGAAAVGLGWLPGRQAIGSGATVIAASVTKASEALTKLFAGISGAATVLAPEGLPQAGRCGDATVVALASDSRDSDEVTAKA